LSTTELPKQDPNDVLSLLSSVFWSLHPHSKKPPTRSAKRHTAGKKMAPHSAMDTVFRTRDLVALGAALVAFFFATQSSPDTSLKLKWYIELDSQSNVSFLYKTTFT
jgi:hypothetical protein